MHYINEIKPATLIVHEVYEYDEHECCHTPKMWPVYILKTELYQAVHSKCMHKSAKVK